MPPGHHFGPEQLARPKGVGAEIVLEVDDVVAAYARASSAIGEGEGTIEPLGERPWGQCDFRVVDPDGYYLRITSQA